MTRPQLTFACELEAAPLKALMDNRLIASLVELKASLCLGILDLSDERAEVVRRLNRAGIPVTAWLLLPKEQGYWFNLRNAPQAVAFYNEFCAWTAAHKLNFAWVGLDIEPDINELANFVQRRWRALPGLLPRLFDWRRLRQARATYLGLIQRIRSDGYAVESYQFPFIADERAVRSTLLQRVGGLVDLPVDREVWMLYSSFVRPHGAGLIASYGPQAQSIGIGVTGGGVDAGIPAPAPLTWDEFARDLRLAWYFCNDLFIFSLEGCVQQGFIESLKTFAWDAPILMPESSQARVDTWRWSLRTGLWIGTHGAKILAAVAGGFVLWKIFRRFVFHKNKV
jgi:hypothetical protein